LLNVVVVVDGDVVDVNVVDIEANVVNVVVKPLGSVLIGSRRFLSDLTVDLILDLMTHRS
jgi:hypothetical protein